jgi:hypothetical protein
MPRCIAFKAVEGSVVRCKSSVISNESMVCNNAHCQSMGVKIWLADSAVAMMLFTYLCEICESPVKLVHDGGDGLLFDVASVNDEPDVAKFVNQIGGGIKSIMGLMEQTTALLRSKGVIIDAECDAMVHKLLVPYDSSNVAE